MVHFSDIDCDPRSCLVAAMVAMAAVTSAPLLLTMAASISLLLLLLDAVELMELGDVAEAADGEGELEEGRGRQDGVVANDFELSFMI